MGNQLRLCWARHTSDSARLGFYWIIILCSFEVWRWLVNVVFENSWNLDSPPLVHTVHTKVVVTHKTVQSKENYIKKYSPNTRPPCYLFSPLLGISLPLDLQFLPETDMITIGAADDLMLRCILCLYPQGVLQELSNTDFLTLSNTLNTIILTLFLQQ